MPAHTYAHAQIPPTHVQTHTQIYRSVWLSPYFPYVSGIALRYSWLHSQQAPAGVSSQAFSDFRDQVSGSSLASTSLTRKPSMTPMTRYSTLSWGSTERVHGLAKQPLGDGCAAIKLPVGTDQAALTHWAVLATWLLKAEHLQLPTGRSFP